MFHTIDRIRRHRLSREGKAKAEKNRRAIEESFLKNTHQQRQEAAQVIKRLNSYYLNHLQARREEKTRERKMKILEEEDPDKQRKLQQIEDKKANKQKGPKVKQMRVK
jgi:hypothetical protein